MHSEIGEKFKVEMSLLSDINQFIREHFEQNSPRKDGDRKDREVLWFLGAKMVKSFRAVKLLVEEGYGTEAILLVRSMLEVLLCMFFIAEDESVERVEMYLAFQWVAKRKHLNKSSSYLGDAMTEDEIQAVREEIEKGFVAACIKYPHFNRANTGALAWIGLDVVALSQRFNMDFWGNTVYTLASDITHSSPLSVMSYLIEGEGSKPSWNTGPGEPYVVEATICASELMLRTFDVLIGFFELKIDDKHKKPLIDKFNSLEKTKPLA